MGIKELFIYIRDIPTANIYDKFQQTLDFIKEDKNQNVLIHCTAGISRSGTIVLNYLMTEHNMSLDDALEFARKKRKIINPNIGFINQLKNYHN
jgi:protein-tyrosine phosphatase